MKKTNTPSWIKVGNKILIAKFDPFRSNIPSEVLKSATEVTIEKVGVKYFYVKGGAPFDKETFRSVGSVMYNKRAFRDRDDVIEFFNTRAKIKQIENNIAKITPEQAKLIHAIMFPHEPACWGVEEIGDSLETIEWYGVASAMFPGSKFAKINGPQVDKAKQELKDVTLQFLSIVAQGILAKHAEEETAKKIGKPKPCKYCGGNCPYDPDNSCDGYQGDIDGLYKAQSK